MKIVHRIVLACAMSAAGIANAAPPATFSIEVGNALLCLNQLNSKYFYDYLVQAFGQPYKTEGGAYWFKAAGSNIWGMEITDVLVNDSTSPADFIGAVVKGTPQALSDAIDKSIGIRFTPVDGSTYALRQSQAGSTIAYADTMAKIYCAKSKYLVPGAQ